VEHDVAMSDSVVKGEEKQEKDELDEKNDDDTSPDQANEEIVVHDNPVLEWETLLSFKSRSLVDCK
jgi:hypothetical protein